MPQRGAVTLVYTMFTGVQRMRIRFLAMSATTRTPDDGSAAADPESTADVIETGSPAPQFAAVAASQKCSVCGAEMADDQRYCVECGTRRGAPRFTTSLSDAGTRGVPAAPKGLRLSAQVVLLAVIAVLVAFGVGILVGHDSSSTINVSAPAAASGSTTPSGSGSGSSTSPASTTTRPTNQQLFH